MSSIRILLVGMPLMLRDIVKGILAAEPRVRIVGELDDGGSVVDQARVEADLAILGLRDSELPEIGVRLLTANPGTRLLGISSDGRKGFIYELRPHAIPLGELSPRVLVNAILRQIDHTTGEE